jgi:hypothetical protein
MPRPFDKQRLDESNRDAERQGDWQEGGSPFYYFLLG